MYINVEALMAKEGNTKILIQLPISIKKYLDDLALEGYTASGYIRGLIIGDRQARIDMGWQPGNRSFDIPGVRRVPRKKRQ
jgi:hypothetical protein